MNKQEIERAIELLRNILPKKVSYSNLVGASSCYGDKYVYEEPEPYAIEMAISALEHQLTNSWIPVSERLPKNEKRVLICAERKLYNGKVRRIITTAMYEDGTLRTDDSDFIWEYCDFEYCEKADGYIIPKGWYEQNMYCEELGAVDDFVMAWQPLPEPYKEVSE